MNRASLPSNAKRFSAGVIPVRRTREGWRLLGVRTFRNWDFPKGALEPGETPIEAAKREVREEVGVDNLDFAWGEGYRDTEPYASGKVARYFIAQTGAQKISLPDSPELGRPEVHEARWLTLADARRLMPPRLQPMLAWVEQVLGPDSSAHDAL